MGKSVTRLYTQFQPEKYELEIQLDEAAMRFSGRVVITGKKVGRPSKRLTFHANGVKVTSGKVTVRDKKGERELPLERINQQKSLHEVRLHTETMAYPGLYTVEMTFEGTITDGMTGIYPCYWKDAAGNEQKLFATQFESHHARETFPCIDEPEAKAIFALTLTTRAGVEVLSNTPVQEQVKDASTGVLRTSFHETPRMSTYLLAFVTGDMHKKTARTKSGVEVNAWATAVQPAESLDFALDAATKSIEYFEDYFGVPYPLAKADHVALPDFSSGAMENWGLITYRERVLLDYPGETSQSTREYIALVVAHETSHQWFGNLVTMRWWDDLWLNESFANMMEYQCVDSMFPEWKVWNMFIASEGLSAFRRDATAGVQPVHLDVHHPDEISTLFDPSIVYAKGGRLLYMLKNYIGEEAFRTGLSAYFTKHAYGNTSGDDLWAALSDASGKDVGAFMTPWLSRSGFPVVHVAQTSTDVTLTQEHFLEDSSKADKTRLWPVPVFSNEVNAPEVLESSQVKWTSAHDSPVTINEGARGHYLVDYATASTKKHLEDLVAAQQLPEADRLMLLNSSAMLARAGYQSYADTLRLLTAYETEASEPVWDIIGLVASEVRRFVDADESLEPHIKTLSRTIIQQQYARLGWEPAQGETAADTKLRGLILGLGAYGENEAILKTMRSLFAGYVKNGTALSAELRPLIMSVPVKEGDASAVDFLLSLHDGTQNSELKSDTSDALTATRDPQVAARLLARLKDGKLVKPQDVDRWLVNLMRNRYTRDTAWQWMVDEWAWLQKTFENDKSYDYLPRYAAGTVNTRAYEQKYHDLFDSKLDQPSLKRNIAIGFEEISSRLTWLERDLKAIQSYFK
jgi:aminopeptidase N